MAIMKSAFFFFSRLKLQKNKEVRQRRSHQLWKKNRKPIKAKKIQTT